MIKPIIEWTLRMLNVFDCEDMRANRTRNLQSLDQIVHLRKMPCDHPTLGITAGLESDGYEKFWVKATDISYIADSHTTYHILLENVGDVMIEALGKALSDLDDHIDVVHFERANEGFIVCVDGEVKSSTWDSRFPDFLISVLMSASAYEKLTHYDDRFEILSKAVKDKENPFYEESIRDRASDWFLEMMDSFDW